MKRKIKIGDLVRNKHINHLGYVMGISFRIVGAPLYNVKYRLDPIYESESPANSLEVIRPDPCFAAIAKQNRFIPY